LTSARGYNGVREVLISLGTPKNPLHKQSVYTGCARTSNSYCQIALVSHGGLYRDLHESYPIHVVRFILISDLITDLISDFGIASMLNYTINHIFGNKIYGMINMEAIPKFDTKSVIKFDIRTKPTT
jgi:hypothetical protein